MRSKLLNFTVIAALAGVIAGVGIARSNDPSPPRPSGAGIEGSFRPSAEQIYAGKAWTAGVVHRRADESCVEMRTPSGQRSRTCVPTSKVVELGPIRAYSGGVGDIRFLYGAVAPTVKSLTLVRSDCSARELEVSSDGVFLRIDSSAVASPYKLRAFDVVGSAVSSKVLMGRGVASPRSGAC